MNKLYTQALGNQTAKEVITTDAVPVAQQIQPVKQVQIQADPAQSHNQTLQLQLLLQQIQQQQAVQQAQQAVKQPKTVLEQLALKSQAVNLQTVTAANIGQLPVIQIHPVTTPDGAQPASIGNVATTPSNIVQATTAAMFPANIGNVTTSATVASNVGSVNNPATHTTVVPVQGTKQTVVSTSTLLSLLTGANQTPGNLFNLFFVKFIFLNALVHVSFLWNCVAVCL